MKYISTMAVAALCLTGLSGCALFKSTKVSTEAVLPTDREHIESPANPVAYTPEEMRKGMVYGDWAIETVGNKDAVGEKAPFIKFVPAEKRIYGSNGCNVINGSYTYNPADSTMSFGNIASTMMMCAKEGLTDTEINIALSHVSRYSWDIKGDNYYLYLYDNANNQLMSLMHQNFDFLNGSWAVKAINGEAVNVEGMDLVIDVDEGKLHGNTGCNILNGALETDMEAANSISFSSIATTRMACPDNDNHETRLLVALEEASTAKAINPEEARLYDSSGKEVLKLIRLTRK